MTDLSKLRELAEKAEEARGLHGLIVPTSLYQFQNAATPSAVLALLDRLEAAERERASATRENESFCKASPREAWEWHRAYAYREPFPPHETIVDWALYWWQVADDEFIPMGEAEDLLAALVLHIEGVEKRAEAAEAKTERFEAYWHQAADETTAVQGRLDEALAKIVAVEAILAPEWLAGRGVPAMMGYPEMVRIKAIAAAIQESEME